MKLYRSPRKSRHKINPCRKTLRYTSHISRIKAVILFFKKVIILSDTFIYFKQVYNATLLIFRVFKTKFIYICGNCEFYKHISFINIVF